MHDVSPPPETAIRREPRGPRGVVLGLLAAFGLVAIGAPLVIALNAPAPPVERVAELRRATRVVPKAELPPVEPVLLAEVDRDDARAFNATIPFSTAPNPAARPFRFAGGEDDRTRAVDCLTSAVLYEAGDDPVGQRAVAQVVLNRARHPAYPNTVCGVVFQGSERRTGCQFTFTCDGALRRTYSAAAWNRARELATAAIGGRVDPSVGHATHYHTDWVVPYWSSSLDKIVEVNTHLFFRWTGWWGTPPAFTRAHGGAEPRIAKLGHLSAAHRSGETVAEGELIDASEVAGPDLPRPTPGDPNSFVVALDARMVPASLAALAIRTCGERPYCKLLAWSDAARVPADLPADDATMAAMSFSYLRDRARGFEKALWNCDEYPRANAGDCMKTRIPVAAPPVVRPPVAASAAPRAAEVAPLVGVRRRPAPAASPSPAAKADTPAATARD